jgi:hypothetical protein
MRFTNIALIVSVSVTILFAGGVPINPVPEPSTWLMIGTAGLGLLALKKFRKK